MAAQALVVAGAGHRDPQQVGVFIHRPDDGGEEQQEPGVGLRGLALVQQALDAVHVQGPVVVLAAAVDPGKGLFMEQAHQVIAQGHFFQRFHGELVLVAGDVDGSIHRRQLVLGRGHLVVLGLGGDAQTPQLVIHLAHIIHDALLDVAVIVVVQLLALGRLGTEQGPAAQGQVQALGQLLLVHKEVFLLGAGHCQHPSGIRVPQQPQNPQGLAVDGLHGAEQGGLFVQHLAVERAEAGGDVQGIILDKGGRGAVPGGVAPGLEGDPQAAGGEGGGVAFAPHQLLAGEAHDDGAVALGIDEAVVLFGGGAGQRLKPVGEVGGALVQGPALQTVGHDVGQGGVLHGTALIDDLFQLLVGVSGKIAAHGAVVEHPGGVVVQHFGGTLIHQDHSSFWILNSIILRFLFLKIKRFQKKTLEK